MKRILLSFISILTFVIAGYSQNKLGEVASIYITTSNLDSSASFYAKLGFQKIGSNEYPNPWIQLSDGSLLITMRKDNTPYIGLTYYSSNVEKIAEQLA